MSDTSRLALFLTRLFAAKCSAFATFTILTWDHLITFDQEVSRVWRQPWTGATLLFVLNRYITPSQFALQILSMMYPKWHGHVCDHLFRLPGASTLFATAMAELILILRTYALYGRSKVILAILVPLFLGHVTVMCVAVAATARLVPLPDGVPGCMMTGSGPSFVLFWTTPWIADTIIFSLTIFKTVQYRRRHARTRLLQILERDGALFYAVIFAINTVNIVIYLFTPQGVKPIGSPFCQSLTTTMISRLQLNLRAPLNHPRLPICPPRPKGLAPGLLTTFSASSIAGPAHLSTVVAASHMFPMDTSEDLRVPSGPNDEDGIALGSIKTDCSAGARQSECSSIEFSPRSGIAGEWDDYGEHGWKREGQAPEDAVEEDGQPGTHSWMLRTLDALAAPLSTPRTCS